MDIVAILHVVVQFLVANVPIAAQVIGYAVVVLGVVLQVLLMIPGDQKEALLQSIIDFLSNKQSKK